ncbi:secreted RxLR effector protein 161-like [Leptopilina heterotoma]|uniref:secreted RxLR effector protein 161-like n=1 Tax=Leptopilina heterotoma TaxID=63436 RepID=UPI001CA9F73E|nr:secreted RxLR effector protein 161-like [Leptopilina heterotoma]
MFLLRQAIGSLLFAARVTRPDIECIVNSLSQFLNDFSMAHWNAVKRILKYLRGTLHFGLEYKASGSKNTLVGFTDADYAGCSDTRRSRRGFVFLLNNAPISWCSQRQSVVSLSTTEAEYIALAQGTKDAVWLRRMLSEL